ncbi:MAG: carboxypeptidase-like regulatory domain-containing protein [Cytophagales bacterium]|nr:carboxypeptidase-like regulatory domain-containing protein [Cytophagales bacterium]
MIQKAFLLKLLLLVVIIPSFGQIKISGNVLDQVAGEPISFVNIGILNANVGTISNDDGSFVIRIPASYLKDTLIFPAIGYGRRAIPISSISISGIVL